MSSLTPWQVKRVAAFVEANIGSNFRVGDLARIAQLSTGHFSRAFKGSFGETPLGYVTRRRMRHAQAIMLSTREPLVKIALDCGMSDQAHFSRVFRRIVGVNPASWRRQFSTPVVGEGRLFVHDDSSRACNGKDVASRWPGCQAEGPKRCVE